MSPIYGYIPADSILTIHDYSGPNKVHTFHDVKFRTDISSFHSFYTPLGIVNSKIISITNKQLSFLPMKMGHFLGVEYAKSLQSTYTTLISDTNPILIEEPVFQFFDYESVCGSVHSYDLMFYLLYIYKKVNLDCKLLVVNSNNVYYNTTLDLIKKHYAVEFYYIDPEKTYTFKEFSCVQSYQNIFFHEVKAFINDTLLTPIIQNYELNNAIYYNNVYKIKIKNPNAIDISKSSHDITDTVTTYFQENNYMNLDLVDEEYRIYLLNKADKIVLTWGSIYYINLIYYITDLSNKQFTLIFHPNILGERGFIDVQGTKITHQMPLWASGNFRNQVYNDTIRFNGTIHAMDTITHI